jgi:thiamine transport system substrate-binding protein
MKRLTVLVAAVLVAAACEGPAADHPQPPRTVTLVTHDSFDVSKSVLRDFELRTGIQVTILPTGDAGQAVNRAILTAGHPEGDVLFGIDDNLLQQGLDADLFEPYESPRLSVVPQEYQLDPEHRVTPIDRGDVCVNVDLKAFATTDDPPSTLDDLPAFASDLVVENPATSTPGLAFLLATIAEYGDPGFEAYWTRLRDGGVTVVDGWERAYFGEFSGAGGGEGTHPLVVSYATSPVAEIVFADPPIDHAPTSVLTATCYRQIEFAGILAGTEHPAEARALIDFLLSEPFQEDVPLKMFVYPVADDAVLPDVFVENAVVPAHPLSLDPSTVAANRADWVSRWTDLMLR